MKHRLESRLLEEIPVTSDRQMIQIGSESEEELKSMLIRVKEEREKAGLKLNIQKNLRSGMGREMGERFNWEGSYVYLWVIHIDVWENPAQFCKAIILQFKK